MRLQDIVQPIAEALKATKSYVSKDGLMVQSQGPDHKIRLEASRDAVALLRRIPCRLFLKYVKSTWHLSQVIFGFGMG